MGKFTVKENLPPHLAQGMFAKPGEYDVIMRYSSLTPKLVPDKISAPRGIGMKIFWRGRRENLGRGQEDTRLDIQQLPCPRAAGSKDYIRDRRLPGEELDRYP